MENLLRKNNIMFHEKERKIKAIMKEESNNKCIDCNNEKPEYISLNNACFICKNCFKIHQELPLNISKTVKNNLKSLTLKELQYLFFGGNKKILEFMKYEYPKLIKLKPLIAYKTIAMEYYRHWLKYLIEGGNKPHKPDIEFAYKSIDEIGCINKNLLLNNNNNAGNVITIDFFNDCYNYNDKFNHTITNFINKKNNRNNNNNQALFGTDKNFYIKMNNSTNKNEYINSNNDINKKYINTQTLNLFSHTPNSFIPKTNTFVNNLKTSNINNYKQKSIEEIILYNNSITNRRPEVPSIINQNIIMNRNDKILKPFKTTNRIYVKPKHKILKSFEKINISNRKMLDYNTNKEIKVIEIRNDKIKDKDRENNNNIDNNDNKDFIKVKLKKSCRCSKDFKKLELNDEIRNKIFIDKNIINSNINNFNNFVNTNDDKNINDKIIKNNIRIKLTKKIFNYNLNNLNNLNKESDSKRKNEIKNNKDTKSTNESRNITNNIQTYRNDINNNIIFKKKNLKNYFFVNLCKKNKRNFTAMKLSQFEILPKKKMNITTDESNDDSLRSRSANRTLSLNKSMKLFYSKYPKKLNNSKSKKKKLNDSKNSKKILKEKDKKKEKKEKKRQKIRKEKSEIIKSLKILLKKKNELSRREESEEEEDEDEEYEKEEEEEYEEEEENNDSEDSNNFEEKQLKSKRNKSNQKININIVKKKKDLKKKVIYINEKSKSKSKSRNKSKIKRINSSSERENEEEEEEKKVFKQKKNITNRNKKKIHSAQSQEGLKKGIDKDYIRVKYKKK